LHPEGLPMVPGDPDNPYRAFDAEADAGMADRNMPVTTAMAHAIEWAVCCRSKEAEEYVTTLVAFDPVTDARVRAVARPGESWAMALESARDLYKWPRDSWPRQMLPCPLCQADYPGRPTLWGWIEVGPTSPSIPDMCGMCEVDPPQWCYFDAKDSGNYKTT